MVQRRFKVVSRVFQFKEVSWECHGYLKEVAKNFQRFFKKVSRLYQGTYKGQGDCKGVTKKF